ncbi:MAG: T9SS type A sorting domain-containing protein [Saprospiraceae bacterium]|nr:T9SS type A sorting domain-containing protein [Saprospiraceae bacterium]
MQKQGKYAASKAVSQSKIRGVAGRTVLIKNVEIPIKKAEPFISVTFGLEGTNLDHETLELSYQTDGKTWQIAQHAHDTDGENPTRWVSEILYLDKNLTKVTFKIVVKNDKTTLKKAGVNFFNPNLPASNTGGGAMLLRERGAVGCELPVAIPRTSWGSGRGLTDDFFGGTPLITVVSHLIVHHSAGPNTSPNWAATVASIFNFHTTPSPSGSGFSDIGYNYLIAPDGTLFVGRGGGKNVQGAHYCGKNNNTMGVCLIGTYTNTAPSDTMLRTLEKLLAWKCIDAKIKPVGQSQHPTAGLINNIDGHRSGCATECPGDQTFNLLSTVRTNVEKIVNPCLSTSLVENLEKLTALIMPNPTSGVLTIRFTDPLSIPAIFQLSDVNGRLIFQEKIGLNAPQSGDFILNLPHSIPNGLYVLHLSDGKRFLTEKIVVNH